MAKKDNDKKSKASKSKVSKSKADNKKQSEVEEDNSILDSLLDGGVTSLLGGLRGISGQAVKMASGKTWEQALKMLKYSPEQMEGMGKAGTSLKDLREVTGLTLSELSSAIDLENPDLLKAVEEGKAGLPFEILLRLASFYARNDPIPFIMKYARTYSPRIWDLMKTLGLDKLTLKAEREKQFINIYRSHDAARQLSDDGFERVRAFTEQAFEMALHFAAEQESLLGEDEQDAVEDDLEDEDDAAEQ